MLPRPILRAALALGGAFSPPILSEGMRLDPSLAALLRRAPARPDHTSPGNLRRQYATLPRSTGLPLDPGVTTTPTLAGPRPARLYTPPTPSIASLLYFHGGGFIMGGLDSHDPLLRRLCARASIRILSVDYRLAPEHPYPAAHEDAAAALTHALHALPRPLVIGGDSAGANLAAFAVLTQPGVALQCLLYPIVDTVSDEIDRYPSAKQYGKGYLLGLEDMNLCARLLAPHGIPAAVDWHGPRLSPMRHDLSQTPPTLITAAGFDPLRDQAYAYARMLRAVGRPAHVWLEPALVHGFADLAGIIPTAAQAINRLAHRLRLALSQ